MTELATFGAAGNLGAPAYEVAVRPPNSAFADRVDITHRVLTLSFEDIETKADKLTITVDNHDLSAFGDPHLQIGNDVVFRFGYPGAWSPEREMKIQKHSGWNPLQIEATGGEIVFGRTVRPEAYWENAKRSDVVRAIGKLYGFTEDRLHIEDTKIVHEQITQGPITDHHFMAALAAKEGFEFYVDFDGLHFHPRRLSQKPLRAFEYFTDPGVGDILNISMDDDRKPGKPGGVTLSVRDPLTKTTTEVRATEQTTADRGALAAERTVVSTFEAIDKVTETTQQPVSMTLPSGNPLQGVAQDLKAPSTETTVEGAQRQANAIYAKQQMRAVTLSVNLRGDGRFLAKSIAQFNRLEKLSGFYYVISVKHDLSQGGGYRMVAKVRRDGHSQRTGEGQFKPMTITSKNASSTPAAPVSPHPSDVGGGGAPAFIEAIDHVTQTVLVPTGGRS
jgi:hypothetical protein